MALVKVGFCDYFGLAVTGILMQRSVCWFQELFDYIVDKVSIFIDKEEDDPKFKLLLGQKRELGFTFSFPVYQTRINSGTLLNWTKDYDIKEAVCLLYGLPFAVYVFHYIALDCLEHRTYSL